VRETRPSLAADERATGITLIEEVVAGSLSLVVLLGALGLLQTFRHSYIRSEMAGDAMQRARIAQESIASDLRLAGLGVDPDGAAGRPDEAIEGAWAGAIAARGDLDADDPAARDDPERWIAGVYPSTRTGNDEVFAYALRKESGSGGADLLFDSDVSSPLTVTTPSGAVVAARDGIVESVRLTRAVAAAGGSCGTGCLLYRASVANNASLWGTGNAIVWQPVSDGISTLGFRYFDESGEEIAPRGGAESEREARAQISTIEVRVVALEKQLDVAWRDPGDTNPATASYRKAEIVFRVALRNGVGVAQPDRPAGPAWPPP